MSSRSNRASAGTFSDRPVERSSITHTVFPLARRRSTIWDPMKPAPPVTTTRDRRPEDSGAPLQPFVRPATARLAAMRPECAAAAASSGEGRRGSSVQRPEQVEPSPKESGQERQQPGHADAEQDLEPGVVDGGVSGVPKRADHSKAARGVAAETQKGILPQDWQSKGPIVEPPRA